MRTIAYGASALALMALAAPASADMVPFADTTLGPTTFTVPETGVYDILAFGAQGGEDLGGFPAGLGAEVGGDFALTAGEVLSIVVGGAGVAGSQSGGGGGGGTFVFDPAGAILIAGGGGGGGSGGAGGPGLASGDGGVSVFPFPGAGAGGVNGSGGSGGGSGGAFLAGSGGGGLSGAGSSTSLGADGGAAAGGAGGAGIVGADGGVGGGGGGGGAGGGGGGGFSGGGGASGQGGGGGGGGSLNDAIMNADVVGMDGVRMSDGELDISLVSGTVPEPSTWAMLLIGFAGLGVMAFRRGRTGSGASKA